MKTEVIHSRDGRQSSCDKRALSLRDLEEVLKLQKRIMTDISFRQEWFYPFSKEELIEVLSSKRNIVEGVFVQERLIAFIALCSEGTEWEEVMEVINETCKKEACMLINGTLVDPDFQGNGLQKQMTQAAMNAGIENGFYTVAVACHPDNPASMKSLYQLGFKMVKKTQLYEPRYERIILLKEQ